MLRKSLRDYRRAIIGWTVGLSAFFMVYLPFYPMMQGEEMRVFIDDFMRGMPEELAAVMQWQDFTSGAGYLHAMVYGLYAQIFFIIAAIVLGVRALAGPEEAGTLELVIAHPVDRRRFVLDRCLALAVAVLIIGTVIWGVVVIFASTLDYGVGIAEITAANLGLMAHVLVYGMLTVAVGALTGRKAITMATSGILAAAGFAMNSLSGIVTDLQPLRWASTFHYALDGEPLRNGFQWGNLGILAAAAVVLAAVAVAGFARRDVGI